MLWAGRRLITDDFLLKEKSIPLDAVSEQNSLT